MRDDETRNLSMLYEAVRSAPRKSHGNITPKSKKSVSSQRPQINWDSIVLNGFTDDTTDTTTVYAEDGELMDGTPLTYEQLNMLDQHPHWFEFVSDRAVNIGR